MFDVAKVQTALKGSVGWEQPIDPIYAIVDSANLTNTSGRKFTDNKYVKVQFVKDTQDYSEITDIDFNLVLSNIEDESIISICDRIFNESDFIDKQLLYQYPNNKTETDSLPTGFVGYRIIPNFEKNYTFEIVRDILEFEGTGNITLRLYNSAKKTFVREQIVNITSTLQEVELGWKMDNTETFYKGQYFYGYMTDSLPVVPIRRNYEAANIKSFIEGLYVENIKVPAATGDLFDISEIEGAAESWGLNPDFLIYDDFTNFIIQNKRLFAYAIQLQGQIQTINVYLGSLRSNANERISSAMIQKLMIELDSANSEGWNKKGLRAILATEITRLKEEVLRIRQSYLHTNSILSVTRS